MEIQKGYVFINLLPYREKNKKEKLQKVITYLSMYAIVAVTLLVGAYSFVSYQIDNQKDRNTYVNKENKNLDDKIKEIVELKEAIKQTLEKRKVVELLQLNRSDAVKLFNNLSNSLPEGTSIKTVVQKQEEGRDKITIVGVTQSNNKVSAYMTALENAGYVSPTLVETKSVQNPSKKANARVIDDTAYNEFTIYMFLPKYDIEEPSNKKGAKNGTN